jgi:hypothetical protein
VQLFGTIGSSISESRAVMETTERLQAASTQLRTDLEGLTVTPIPPRPQEGGEGYLEIIKGPVVQTQLGPGPVNLLNNFTIKPKPIITTNSSYALDTSVGALNNAIMFTAKSKGKPFIGRFNGNTMIESDTAEIAWFMRGSNLYRRVLLVAPKLIPMTAPITSWNFYANYDISVRWVNDGSANGVVVANTLNDLTRRECRFAHPLPSYNPSSDIRLWDLYVLPTLRECSAPGVMAGRWDATWFGSNAFISNATKNHWNNLWSRHPELNNQYVVDFWSPEPVMNFGDAELVADGVRTADDLVLTNVLSFDIKVWDPFVVVRKDAQGLECVPGETGYATATNVRQGAYVNLGYENVAASTSPSNAGELYYHLGDPKSMLEANPTYPARVYDSWCTIYDYAPNVAGVRANDGFDNTNIGIVDNEGERTYAAPYPAPLRGVQIKIRVFEPDSRATKEVTIQQDFLPK